MSHPRAQVKVEILRLGRDAVGLVEPVVWVAVSQLCLGGLTKAHSGCSLLPAWPDWSSLGR